jgi:outer membrane immunogenic protein
MNKLVITGIVLATLGAARAQAADMPVRPAPLYKAPTPAVSYRWTSCFLGVHGGGIWTHKSWVTGAGDPSGAGLPFGSHNASGGLGGGQIGCDYQFYNNVVVGIQGDAAWVGANGSSVDAVNNAFFATTGYIDHTKVKSLSSVTGRLGYGWDRFLAYARGGIAWERDDYSITDPTGALAASASEIRTGWTVGGGAEYGFTNWISGFVEYNYYDFGTRSNRFLTPGGTLFDVADIRERKSVVKAGVNVRWGGNY